MSATDAADTAAHPELDRTLRQHDPHAVDGRGAAGQLRPPGHADGDGAGGLRALAAAPALRSRRSDLAESRSVRALDGPRVDAAVFDAASGGREGRQSQVRERSASCRCRSTTSSTSASSIAAARAIPNIAGRPASRRRRARSDRGWRRASAWRSRRSGWPRTSTGPDFEMFDFDVYALAGDGCLMEGISSEAASLAGHLALDNLCWIYDNNHITIEGHTSLAFSEDVATRFISYGWNVTRVGDANDLAMLDRAFQTFKDDDRPADARSSSTATSATARRPSRTRTRRTANRSATRRSGSPSASTAGRRTRSSSCPTACASTSPRTSARAARRCAPNG